jgi:hypothetical protein
MSKRIDELIGKALDQAVPYTWHHLNRVQMDDVMEKFAELIVRECAGIADEYDGVGSTIVSRIQKHFGVEE